MKRHRLYRTLKRKCYFRDFKEDDLKYVWASYKLEQPIDISAKQFHDEFINLIMSQYDYAWTLIAKTKYGKIPIGFIYGINVGPFIHVNNYQWFEWASVRNKLESILNFAVRIKRKHIITCALNIKFKPLYDHVIKYGVIRRIGNIFLRNEKAAIFQTRTK